MAEDSIRPASPCAIDFTSSGSIMRAASSETSATAVVPDSITGVLAASASTIASQTLLSVTEKLVPLLATI